MKKKVFFLMLVLFGVGVLKVEVSGAEKSLPRPKLVVGIVIDQMRSDYLYRYYDRYGKGGFRRMLTHGAVCENNMMVHLPSYTAVGHSMLYTGTTPSINGIAGNDFVDQKTGRSLYCTADSLVKSVGSTSSAGRMSPRNLLASTITDELRLATNFRAKVISVSLKDRASILPAGHCPTGAFWFDASNGSFITSTYYSTTLPDWLLRFNREDNARKLLTGTWNTLYPIETYVQSTVDDSPYERPYLSGQRPVFPYLLDSLFARKGYEIVKSLPAGNTLTTEVGIAALKGEQLGCGDQTDFLAISYSSPDYIGHQFGPNAIETEDSYLRLDQDLARLFDALDNQVGKGNYLVFLTADHGGANNIEFLKDHGFPTDNFNVHEIEKALKEGVKAKFGVDGLLRGISNYSVNINYEKVKETNIDLSALKCEIVALAEQQDGIAYAIDMKLIMTLPLPAVIREKAVNGYNRAHTGEVLLIPQPGWYETSGSAKVTGTTHGTWHPYDAHIPLLFMGWGIQPGHLYREVHAIDLAPTLAALLHIQMPNGCIGVPIPEVISKKRK